MVSSRILATLLGWAWHYDGDGIWSVRRHAEVQHINALAGTQRCAEASLTEEVASPRDEAGDGARSRSCRTQG